MKAPSPMSAHVECIAHARKKFIEAMKVTKSYRTQSVIAQIGKLYALVQEFKKESFLISGSPKGDCAINVLS